MDTQPDKKIDIGEQTIDTLRSRYVLVANAHVKTWQGFLILGLVVGVVVGISAVVNRQGELNLSSAKNTYTFDFRSSPGYTVNSAAPPCTANCQVVIPLPCAGCPPPPPPPIAPTGDLHIRATLDGNPWPASGSDNAIRANYVTPYGSGFNLPVTIPTDSLSLIAQKPYTFTYISGGPVGATFNGITPSASQIIGPGESKTFTFNFSTPPPGSYSVAVTATQATCSANLPRNSITWKHTCVPGFCSSGPTQLYICSGSATCNPLTGTKLGTPGSSDGSFTHTNLKLNTIYRYQTKTSFPDVNSNIFQITSVATCVPPDTQFPVVSFNKPLNNAILPKGTPIIIKAVASDNVGVTKVEFLADDKVLCTISASPYKCTWTPTIAKSYLIKAKVYDAAGNMTKITVSVVVK